MKSKVLILTFVFLVIFTGVFVSGLEAAYPEKPVMMVVPFPPGGSTDMAARALADVLPDYLGVPVGVENHSGGAGAIGALDVVNANPDGYTIGVLPIGPICVAPAIQNVGYTPEDLTHIAQFCARVPIMVGRPDAPWHDLSEVVEAAKESPGNLTYMCPKTAVYPLMLELLNQADVKMQHIPSKGDTDSVKAIMSSDVDTSALVAISVASDHIKAGNMKAYAVFSNERSDKVPDVPTAKEFGYDVVVPLWTGVQVPKGTPDTVVKTISSAVKKAIKDPKFIEIMEKLQLDIQYLNQEQFTNRVEKHFDLFSKWK